MTISQPVRYGLLALVGVLAAGLIWSGVRRYQAEGRALAFAAETAAQQKVEPEDTRAEAQPSPPAEKPKPMVVVHVAGAVAKPGVYQLEQGARLGDAILAAGGALPDGVPEELNLAEVISDGAKVFVFTRAQLEAAATQPVEAKGATSEPVKATGQVATGSKPTPKGKVNLNTATAAQLEAVKGIGPAMAQKIVDYRTAHGPFKRLEDLLSVSGIGPKTLEKIQAELTI